jgi:hypothetical protein
MPPPPGSRPGDNEPAGAAPGARPDPAAAPVLSIVKGSPSAEEVAAAVVALITAHAAPASPVEPGGRIRSQWSSRSRLLREPLPRGPGGWRASFMPR